MESKTRSELVDGFLAALEGFEPERVGEFLTDDARWWWPQSSVDHGFIPTRCAEGRAAVLTGVAQAPNRSYQNNQLTLRRSINDGDMSAVFFVGEGLTKTGNEFVNEYMILLRFADQKICEGWFFVDTDYAYSRIK